MQIIMILFLIILPISLFAEKMETSEIILSIFNDPDNDEHICRRAKEFTDGNITKEQCLEKLPTSKETCGGIINNYVGMYVTDEKAAKWVVNRTIVCQVWTVLGYETIADERGISYARKEGGVLP